MTDYISRADAIEAVAQQWLFEASVGNPYVNDDDIGEYRKLAEELFEDVPSADAVEGWRIGKPPEQGEYMVTLDSFGYKHIDLFYYDEPMMPNRKVRGKCWYRSDDEWGDVVYDDTDILAWQPLPKPYKGGAE